MIILIDFLYLFAGTLIYNSVGLSILDIFVGIFATISTIMHLRSLMKSAHFVKIVRAFFLQKFNHRLKWRQVLPLFNMWFMGVILGNCLATVGAIMKLIIAFKVGTLSLYCLIYKWSYQSCCVEDGDLECFRFAPLRRKRAS